MRTLRPFWFISLLMFAATAHAQTFDECGTLAQRPTCLTLVTDAGVVWYLGGAGVQEHGARVHVRGTILQAACLCPWAQGCIGEVQITPCQPPPACRADFDRSGGISVQDLFDFLAAYFVGLTGPSPPGGDFDQSGAVSVQDIFEFLAAWFAGCS